MDDHINIIHDNSKYGFTTMEPDYSHKWITSRIISLLNKHFSNGCIPEEKVGDCSKSKEETPSSSEVLPRNLK